MRDMQAQIKKKWWNWTITNDWMACEHEHDIRNWKSGVVHISWDVREIQCGMHCYVAAYTQ